MARTNYERCRRLTQAEVEESDDPDLRRADDPCDYGPARGARSPSAQAGAGVEDLEDTRPRHSAAGTAVRYAARCLGCGRPVTVAQRAAARVRACPDCASVRARGGAT